MPNPLSARTIELVKQSAPAVAAHASDITKMMYWLLFKDEHIKALFNQANHGENGSQVHALAAAIVGYAQNIDNLAPLLPVIERIAHKHIGFHILSEHYPYVAKSLLAAIREVLGEAVSEELIDAWGEAYWFLADTLIEREEQIRAELEKRAGGWNGWREFRVAEKIKESDVVTSFVLRPVDGQGVALHRAGQYLTFDLSLPDGSKMKRNYSISSGPNQDFYRISVKREENGKGASRYLHDHVAVGTVLKVTPPAGDFYLPEEPTSEMVLLSGGVGLTPMVSMLEAIAGDYPDVEAHFVHGAMNSSTHAMDKHVRSLAQRHGRVSVSTFYSEPAARDVAGFSHDEDGFITRGWLEANTPIDTANFYICGPKPFLRSMVSDLRALGVSSDRIHYEFFGPADELLAA
jgi:nitric oxide dioxygenase